MNLILQNKNSNFKCELWIVCSHLQVDVSKYDEVVGLYAQVKRDLGTVDILINNAGIVPLMSLYERPPEDIQRIMDVNVLSHFWVSVTRDIKFGTKVSTYYIKYSFNWIQNQIMSRCKRFSFIVFFRTLYENWEC